MPFVDRAAFDYNKTAMQTKLSTYCDKVIEVGWLAALITTPLFFHVFSSRVFEPDKLTLLRSIALVMAVAWVIKQAEAGLFSDDESHFSFEPLRTPLVLPTLLLVVVYIITTIASVAPHISLWGSYQRLQGTYTTFSYVVIFFLVLSTLRQREQLERLMTVAISVSIPIALYGILQHYQLDPLPWSGDVTTRVASSMGNPIFVAAYLIMVVPLTAARWVQSVTNLLRDEDGVQDAFVQTAVYAFILALQFIAIFFTQSRGPWMGLMAGLFFFVLLLAVSRRVRWLSLAAIAAAVALGAFLVVFNLPGSPLTPLRDVPYIGRLGRVFETETGTGKVRVLIWEGAIDLVTADSVRTVIGYGPETMYVAYNPYYPPELAHYEARNASPDRAHNETFDALVTTGIIGFAAYLSLFTSAFYYGLKWLGLVTDRWQRNTFLMLWFTGGALAALGFYVIDGTWRFFGVALPAGMIVGFFVYLFAHILYAPEETDPGTSYQQLVLTALMAAIVAHFVEIHFGIAIAATRTYFWTLAGLMVVVGHFATQEPTILESSPETVAPRSRGERRSRGRRTRKSDASLDVPLGNTLLLASSLMIGIVLVTMVFDLIVQPGLPEGPIVWILGLTWLVSGLVITTELSQRGIVSSWLPAFAVYASVTFLWVGLYFALHTAALPPGGDVTTVLVFYYASLFSSMLVLAFVLLSRTEVPRDLLRANRAWLYPLLLIGVGAVIVKTNVNPIRADVYYKQGVSYENASQHQRSINRYQRALDLAPNQDFYYLFLGRSYLERGRSADDPQQREMWLERSRQALGRARALNPLNTDHTANLARLHRTWAELAQNSRTQQQKLERALQYYSEATKLSPNNAQLWNEWGMVHSMMGNHQKAVEKFQHSLQLDQEFAQTYLLLGDSHRERQQWDRAVEAYEKGIELNPNSVQAHSALAYVYAQQGRTQGAIEENEEVLALKPDDVASHRNLALLHQQLGQMDEAIAHAQAALELSPDDQSLQAFLNSLQERSQQGN